MKTMLNKTHIEGYIYEHSLESKVSGATSKNPGTPFITGNLSIATDDNLLNVVVVHFSYVTPTTSKGGTNATFTVLNNIIQGNVGSVMKDGKEKAGKVRIDSAIGLNEFYTDRNGQVELVSAKRNEGGFVHLVDSLNSDEKTRNTFECDMLITNVIRVEANEEKQTPEKVVVKGYIFDFRKAIMPIDFVATNTNAMNYFEDLNASPKEPVFTKVWGRQVSEVITHTIVEESAFDEDRVKTVDFTRKEYVITGANKVPHLWDDESTMTVEELKEAIANRETYLASVKQRQDEYKASKNQAKAAAFTTTNANSEFNF
jgi:hypothetical protein